VIYAMDANAVSESWFATLKSEVVDPRPWPTRDGLRRAVFEFIEGWSTPAGCTAASATAAPPSTKPFPGRRVLTSRSPAAGSRAPLSTFGRFSTWSSPDPTAALRVNAWRARHWPPAVRAPSLAPLRPHDLRHTAVALWIAAGASRKQVATWAGHTSVALVLDPYWHLFPGHE
jgi:hypothetical protein